MTQSRFTGLISALDAKAPRCVRYFRRDGLDVNQGADQALRCFLRQLWSRIPDELGEYVAHASIINSGRIVTAIFRTNGGTNATVGAEFGRAESSARRRLLGLSAIFYPVHNLPSLKIPR
jgi:hypothetical protein